MAKLTSLGIIVVLCGVVSASDPLWTNLKVTFGKFTDLPKTQSEAELGGWQSISEGDCRNNGQFQGHRYTNNSDNSLSILFDKQGSLAGVQMNLLVEELQAGGNDFDFYRVPMYQKNTIDGADYYTFTVYLQRPGAICSTGRSPSDVKKKGIATDMYFQDGVNNYLEAPKKRKDALKLGTWSNNYCFPAMGWHSFYAAETWPNDDCRSIKPAFLLYDIQNRLIGFGLLAVGTARSPVFENPGYTNLIPILGDSVCADKIYAPGGVRLTVLHGYLISNPEQVVCA